VTYNITYNQRCGGYGYYGPGGAWIMYDVMRDAVMVDMLMSHNNYYVGAAPAPVVVTDSSCGAGAVASMIIVLIVFAAFVIIIGRFASTRE